MSSGRKEVVGGWKNESVCGLRLRCDGAWVRAAPIGGSAETSGERVIGLAIEVQIPGGWMGLG